MQFSMYSQVHLHSGNKIGWKILVNKSTLYKKNVWFASIKTYIISSTYDLGIEGLF